MHKLLEVSHLTKKYGKKTIFDDVTFSLDCGKIVGVLGRNASGKTTLFKILAGLTKPSGGDVRILGREIGLETKNLVSFMPDSADFVKWARISDAKEFYRDFYADYDETKFRQLLEWMELQEEQKIGSLSKGTKERLQLALALSRNAKLYILDEPVTGVDPVIRDKILDAIVRFYNEDSTILISTHFITQMERLFDSLLLLKEKKIMVYDNPDIIRETSGNSLEEWVKEEI
ncbi:ABC transporter ATP-binding protein [Desulfosporosinus sp. PR]|uniref:ABC transporter ATP-binding protein n=1 Tax=Candidatus Desulfosporosinus nitrosoreducens TaxID=3401928 RepID=UPI0027EFD068|nr:ABC transporter ATP-binding protein [Desulfosporosinus sp. PR]MDQ7095349.1 ABC transporter ATP-binding protein [Desulfosporosinus sp. PR]